MIATAIGACEAAFWLLLLGGLTARYVIARPRVGAVLLMCVPLVDGVLLAVTAVHLVDGAQADWTHGMAAVYLGFSVVLGPELIRDFDRRFARRFGDGTPPAADGKAAGSTWQPSGASGIAVFRLMTSSNLVGCWTGRSAGLALFRGRQQSA